MNGIPLEILIAIAFPFVFVGFWLAITFLIGWISGWHALAARYPNRGETATTQLTWRSGRMGPLSARMNGVLWLDVCRSGLRVALLWPFAVFNKPFFVPWDDIQVTRIDGVFLNEVQLKLGRPQIGTLTISEGLAKEIAAAAPHGKWRETR